MTLLGCRNNNKIIYGNVESATSTRQISELWSKSIYTMLSVNLNPVNRHVISQIQSHNMAEIGVKMSVDNYFNLDVERMLSSDISNDEETHEKLQTRYNSGKRMFCETKSKTWYGKRRLSGILSLENMEKDLMRRMKSKKLVLEEFAEKALDIYSTKFMELLRKQEMEKRELKNNFVDHAKSEIEEWKKCLSYLRREEEKLMKILNHLKTLYNSPQFQHRRLRKLADIHTDFIQKYQKLLTKHNSEVKLLKEVVSDEVSEVKRNLSQEFWKKESEVKKNSSGFYYSHCQTN